MAESPNDARLQLTVDWPEITLERLSRIAGLWASLVQSVSAEATGKREAVRWIVSDITHSSPLRVDALPEVVSRKVNPAVVYAISHGVIAGVEHLASFADRPDLFSSDALGAIRKLALLADTEKGRRFAVSNGSAGPVDVSSRIVASVDDILGPIAESYGSVEGPLEGLITHGRRRFYVYDALNGRQVRCFFDESAVPLGRVLKAFGKRVVASGLIRAKAKTGQPLSIQASRLSIFDLDEDLPSTGEILRMWGAE